MEKKSCCGIVLHDGNSVGSFRYHTAEDSYGRRSLINVTLNEAYMDVATGESKELRFCFMEEISPNYLRLVEDLGVGTISGQFFSFENVAVYDEAVFLKSAISKKELN